MNKPPKDTDHQEAGLAQQLLTVREVADVLKVSTSLVYLLIESRKLACHRIGNGRGAIRVRRDDLDRFLEQCRVEPEQPAVRPSRPRLKHLRLK